MAAEHPHHPTPHDEALAAERSAVTVEEIIRRRLSDALGGWRGSIESALPTLAFVLVWSARQDVRSAVIAAVTVVLALGVVRIAQRQSLQYVLTSLVVTGIAAFFALRSGRAEDAFLPGILYNAGMMAAAVVSVVTRWPIVGFMVGVADPKAAEDPFGWRRDRSMVTVCQRLTLVLVATYAVRLAVMVPLYLAGNVGMLAVGKVALGWPLWVAGVTVMGWMLVRGRTPHTPPVPELVPAKEQDR